MLEKIYIKNISSIGECEIDFKKNSYKYREENLINDIVNPVAIYGHNGSGKTAILRAIKALVIMLIRPVDQIQPFIVNNLLFDKYNIERNENYIQGKLILYFNLKKDCYVYEITTSAARMIVNETLMCNSEKVFVRSKKEYKYGSKKGIISDSYLVPTLRKLANIEINDSKIQDVYNYLSSFSIIELPYINSINGFVTSKIFETTSKFDLLVDKSSEVKNILKEYKEFPIYDIVKNESTNNMNIVPELQYSIKLESNGKEYMLPYTMISSGMQNQSLLLSILMTVPSNSVIFIDELEQALHPSAIKSFLNVVREKKIQLIFTSHNTFILQDLRPDQIYFSKWNDGFSSCDRLSSIYPNIREVNNIEKMYLSGVFEK